MLELAQEGRHSAYSECSVVVVVGRALRRDGRAAEGTRYRHLLTRRARTVHHTGRSRRAWRCARRAGCTAPATRQCPDTRGAGCCDRRRPASRPSAGDDARANRDRAGAPDTEAFVCSDRPCARGQRVCSPACTQDGSRPLGSSAPSEIGISRGPWSRRPVSTPLLGILRQSRIQWSRAAECRDREVAERAQRVSIRRESPARSRSRPLHSPRSEGCPS